MRTRPCVHRGLFCLLLALRHVERLGRCISCIVIALDKFQLVTRTSYTGGTWVSRNSMCVPPRRKFLHCRLLPTQPLHKDRICPIFLKLRSPHRSGLLILYPYQPHFAWNMLFVWKPHTSYEQSAHALPLHIRQPYYSILRIFCFILPLSSLHRVHSEHKYSMGRSPPCKV